MGLVIVFSLVRVSSGHRLYIKTIFAVYFSVDEARRICFYISNGSGKVSYTVAKGIFLRDIESLSHEKYYTYTLQMGCL